MSELEGLRIRLTVSDPWDFGTVNGCGPFSGELLRIIVSSKYAESAVAVVKLEKSLYYKSSQYEYLFLQPRLRGIEIKEIAAGSAVPCNMTAITARCAKAIDPLASWEGVGEEVLIGDISKA